MSTTPTAIRRRRRARQDKRYSKSSGQRSAIVKHAPAKPKK